LLRRFFEHEKSNKQLQSDSANCHAFCTKNPPAYYAVELGVMHTEQIVFNNSGGLNLTDKNNVQEEYDKCDSREEVIKCPHMGALLSYLHKEHDFPRYGWLNNGLRYHYTDAQGLLGIIQNGRLWATDIRFLNDPSEGSFLPERLIDLMESKPGGISDTERKVIKGLQNALRNPGPKYSSFCASLSANGDLLSQWRGYGSFGNGYSVGLSLEGGLPHPQVALYYEVKYGDDGLEELAFDLLDLFVSSVEKWKDKMFDEWISALRVLAKSSKDPSYSEEQESRLVCSYYRDDNDGFQNEKPLQFRARGSDIIPYLPISLNLLNDGETPRLPIKRIVVGPGVDFDRNYISINELLKAHSYDDVVVEPSVIPFRP
jgi:hypothetical protein